MDIIFVFAITIVAFLFIRDEIREKRNKEERSYLIDAVLSKNLNQLTFAQLMKKQRKPTKQDHRSYLKTLEAPDAPGPGIESSESDPMQPDSSRVFEGMSQNAFDDMITSDEEGMPGNV